MKFSRQDKSLTEEAQKGRENQKQRTRRALIEAGIQIVREGRPLVIAAVAEAALVSTATAYRYFPSPQSLWIEVGPRALQVPKLEDIVDGAPEDPVGRLQHAIEAIGAFQFRDEALWRAVMHATLERWLMQVDLPEEERVPVRGDTRIRATKWALGSLEKTIPPALFQTLTNAVMLIYGMEAMIVTRDACGLDADEALDVMKWAARALIRTALAEAEDPGAR